MSNGDGYKERTDCYFIIIYNKYTDTSEIINKIPISHASGTLLMYLPQYYFFFIPNIKKDMI